MEFNYDGGGLAKGGNVVLYVDGSKVGEGRVDMTQPMFFSCDETLDVGDVDVPMKVNLAKAERHFHDLFQAV